MPRRFNGSIPRPQSRRFRVSVPDADESVLAWIGAQSDLSASVRALIRDAIERHGYRDATCYPVQQQPRRGRIPEQIAALVEPKMELLMVRASDESSDETPDVLHEPEVPDDPDESYDTTDAETGSANENAIEDMLGALR